MLESFCHVRTVLAASRLTILGPAPLNGSSLGAVHHVLGRIIEGNYGSAACLDLLVLDGMVPQ